MYGEVNAGAALPLQSSLESADSAASSKSRGCQPLTLPLWEPSAPSACAPQSGAPAIGGSPCKTAFQRVCAFESLLDAHYHCRLGKRHQSEVVNFEVELGQNIARLSSELERGTYRMRPYRQFYVYDPKERLIHAPSYRDRVAQYSLCSQALEPYFERHLIYDNAASRKGKGTAFALDRLSMFLKNHYKQNGAEGYFLKFDVSKYFDSIDHGILIRMLAKSFGHDEQLMRLLLSYVRSYHALDGKGLPLGNQSSQWFALFYLDGLDRIIKERFRVKHYTRYMDDGVLVHGSKELLRELLEEARRYLRDQRALELNAKTQIVPISQGVDYLGFHVYLTSTGKVVRKLRASNKRRLKRMLKRMRSGYMKGKISKEAIEESVTSYCAHLSQGNCEGIKRQILAYKESFVV